MDAAAVALALCAPTFFAVTRVSALRPFAPLAAFSAPCAAAAALFTAASVTLQLMVIGPGLFILVAPPVIGVAPWAAGELCSGPSRRQDESFAAAVVAAYAGALVAVWIGARFAGAAIPAAAATVAYLVTREE